MTDGLVTRLQQSYQRHCDGSWEHQFGVTIDTLDNPGWRLRVQLAGTPLHLVEYGGFAAERSEADWVRCRVNDGMFEGFGGAGNLDELLKCFLDWADRSEPRD